MNLRSDCADGCSWPRIVWTRRRSRGCQDRIAGRPRIIRGLNSSSPPGASRSTALICPPMEIGRLHGGDTCSNPPQRKMTFFLRLQFRTARFLLNRSFARKNCVAAPGVHPTTRRRTARSWRWPARLSSHRSISFRHWRRQFSTSPSVILPALVC